MTTVSPHILVADDEPDIPYMVRAILDRTGRFRVSTVNSGDEALRVCRREHVDVLLLDVMMPGISGIAVCERLKADPKTAGIHVVMFSAMAQRADVAAGRQAGADTYLTKPFMPQQLIDTIDRVLGNAKAA